MIRCEVGSSWVLAIGSITGPDSETIIIFSRRT
jgi:hypothetical protein